MFWECFLDIFGNCELVKNSTTLERQREIQGLAGFGSVYVVLFFGYGFWMALGINFY